MQRLTGLDAGFLYTETPTQHLQHHEGGPGGPSSRPGGHSFERVHEVLASRLADLPAFRRRLVPVPGNLHHPLGVEDDDFDLDRHPGRVRAPEPGHRRALDAVASDAASVALDRRITINDVVLAICAGALRIWLEEGGQLPQRSLVASVPVSTRDEFRVGAANRVSNLFVAVPVNETDVTRRLHLIHDAASGAKAQNHAPGPEMLPDWSKMTPAPLFAALVRAYSRLNLADWHGPPINLVVSNVPGPSEPLYVAGARLQGLPSMGPILENIGLNVTVWSYVDQLNFGLVGCPDLTPDLSRLTDLLVPALEELVGVAA